MGFLTWYLSGILLCGALEYLDSVREDEDIVINLELISMVAIISIGGLLLIIPVIGCVMEITEFKDKFFKFFKKPLITIPSKTKGDEND